MAKRSLQCGPKKGQQPGEQLLVNSARLLFHQIAVEGNQKGEVVLHFGAHILSIQQPNCAPNKRRNGGNEPIGASSLACSALKIFG